MSLSTKRIDRKAFISAAATAMAASIAVPQNVQAGSLPLIGERAPYFQLPNCKDGEMISLDDLTRDGRWTVLYFYPGAFTNGCTLEARNFQKDIDKYSSLNAQIVGISADSVQTNAQFCRVENLDFMTLSDAENGKVSKAFGTSLRFPGLGTFSNRQTYIIDPSGKLQHVFVDVESRIDNHSKDVLEKLMELQKSG